jgi:hypothetical protein
MNLGVPSKRAPGCASDLELDELLAGDLAGQPKEAQLRGHVEGCARCRERLAVFAAVEPPPPPSWPAQAPREISPAHLAGAAGGSRRRRLAAGLVTLGAAGAALIVMLWPGAGPQGDRTKGALALTVFVKHGDGAIEQVNHQGMLRAGDEMRFSVVSAKPGYAIVLGLDTAPAVTVYVPSAPGLPPIRIEGGTTALPGSIVADDTAGAERVTALVCDVATSLETLRTRAAAALAEAHGVPERVTSLGTGCVESSVVMRKVEGGR